MNGTDMCGCCEGISAQTPAVIDNRSSLSAIAYRIGTWAQFKSSMLDALSKQPELAALKTRSDDDFAIALCDAFAIVCDILTFYYERSANEHYLRTATQIVSVAQLAALIGYEPAPGVAASAALAFTLDAPPPVAPGSAQPPQPALVPTEIPLPAGVAVQSVPGPGQTPVTFETVAPITARYAWNALSPRLSVPYANELANRRASYLRLKTLIGTLLPGDFVLIAVGAAYGLRRVASVSQDTATQTTLVTFESIPGGHDPVLAGDPSLHASTLDGVPSQSNLQQSVIEVTWDDQTDFVAQAAKLQWDVDSTQDTINALLAQGRASAIRVYKLGVRATIFGHNAPSYASLPAYTTQSGNALSDWDNPAMTLDQMNKDINGNDNAPRVYLDAVYTQITAGSLAVLLQGERFDVASVTARSELSLAKFLLSSSVTELTLQTNADMTNYLMRRATVLGVTETYAPADELLDATTVNGSLITLDSAQLGLQPGQDLLLTGTSATRTGQTGTELRTIFSVSLVGGRTQIALDKALDDSYVWNTVAINANVAPATHGQSCSQILGSGNASLSYQTFALNQLPVTYVSAATPSGIASTLSVRVNGTLWTEVPYLYGHGPTERVYVTKIDVKGNRFVEFGDGVENGARLPTGQNNVIARYRQGLGSAGNTGAKQLSTLLSRPLGLRSAINPLPASGGGDPQTIGDAQATAPITVRALDRVVSLDDYTDFAGASAAIAKAEAVWAFDGTRRVICITVSGPAASPIEPETAQYDNLVSAIQNAGDGTVAVRLCSFVPRTFTVGATLTVDPSLDADSVVANAKAALGAAFGFEARDFMQPVYASEVIATIQDVPGVIALTLDSLRYSDGPKNALMKGSVDYLLAYPPHIVNGALTGAELLTIDTGPLPNVVHA